MNGGQLDHWIECLIIVHSRMLCEAPENPASHVSNKGAYVSNKGAISLELLMKYPFAGHNVGTWWSWHKDPRCCWRSTQHTPLP
jgi:hypothetical protein